MFDWLLDLDASLEAAEARRPAWESAGLSLEIRRGTSTPKPMADVRLYIGTAGGELAFWVSGEAELAWYTSPGSEIEQRHFDGLTTETIRPLLDLLAEKVLAAQG